MPPVRLSKRAPHRPHPNANPNPNPSPNSQSRCVSVQPFSRLLSLLPQCFCHHLVSACDWYAASRRPRGPTPPGSPSMLYGIHQVQSIHLYMSLYISYSRTCGDICRRFKGSHNNINNNNNSSSRSRMRVLNEILSAHSKMYFTLASNGYYDFIMCTAKDNKIKI